MTWTLTTSNPLNPYTTTSTCAPTTTVNVMWTSSAGTATTTHTMLANQQAQTQQAMLQQSAATNSLSQQQAQLAMQMHAASAAKSRYGGSLYPLQGDVDVMNGVLRLPKGWAGIVSLEDGTNIVVETDGKMRIVDENAKVTYRANRVREFNRFLNASDLLREFIADVGAFGAKQSDVLTIPIELFINWLIMKSAEQDGDATHGALIHPRCRWCSRFISFARAQAGILFCGEQHAINFMRKERLA